MKMSLTGKIIFSNNLSDIFSGDSINLIIEIENQEKVFIKELFLNLFGEMYCQWDDLINKNIDGEIVYLMENFKDQGIIVDKNLIIQTLHILNKGTHVYNVVLNIPQQLPESVTWKYGSVIYELKLGICSTKGSQILHKMCLNVKRYLNICLDRKYMQPFHTAFKKSLCWGICLVQPIKIILTLPNTCFLSGESLSYFIKIENVCKLLDLRQISILLTQSQHYKVLKPIKRVKQVHTTLKQLKHNFTANHHNSKLHGFFVLPENLIPSSPSKCFLDTSYNLHFIFVFTGLHMDEFVSVPIKIGSHRNNLEKNANFTKDETILEIGEGDKKAESDV